MLPLRGKSRSTVLCQVQPASEKRNVIAMYVKHHATLDTVMWLTVAVLGSNTSDTRRGLQSPTLTTAKPVS